MSAHKFKAESGPVETLIYCEYCGLSGYPVSNTTSRKEMKEPCPNAPKPIVTQLGELVQKLIDEAEYEK